MFVAIPGSSWCDIKIGNQDKAFELNTKFALKLKTYQDLESTSFSRSLEQYIAYMTMLAATHIYMHHRSHKLVWSPKAYIYGSALPASFMPVYVVHACLPRPLLESQDGREF